MGLKLEKVQFREASHTEIIVLLVASVSLSPEATLNPALFFFLSSSSSSSSSSSGDVFLKIKNPVFPWVQKVPMGSHVTFGQLTDWPISRFWPNLANWPILADIGRLANFGRLADIGRFWLILSNWPILADWPNLANWPIC